MVSIEKSAPAVVRVPGTPPIGLVKTNGTFVIAPLSEKGGAALAMHGAPAPLTLEQLVQLATEVLWLMPFGESADKVRLQHAQVLTDARNAIFSDDLSALKTPRDFVQRCGTDFSKSKEVKYFELAERFEGRFSDEGLALLSATNASASVTVPGTSAAIGRLGDSFVIHSVGARQTLAHLTPTEVIRLSCAILADAALAEDFSDQYYPLLAIALTAESPSKAASAASPVATSSELAAVTLPARPGAFRVRPTACGFELP